MSAKRFRVETIEEELYPMPIYYDEGKRLQYYDIVDLLNELAEENEQCKMMIATLRNIILENGIDVE